MSAIWLFAKTIGLPMLKIIGIPALIGLAYWVVNDRAYNRGHAAGWADNTAAQKKAIQIKKDAAEKGRAELNRLPPEKIDAELIKRCVAACQQEPKCEAACKN